MEDYYLIEYNSEKQRWDSLTTVPQTLEKIQEAYDFFKGSGGTRAIVTGEQFDIFCSL